MTLRKKEGENQPEFDPSEVIKMEKFTKWIKELAVYLGQFTGGKKIGELKTKISTVEQFDDFVRNYNYFEKPRMCLTGLGGKSQSQYVHIIVESIFPNLACKYTTGHNIILPYNCKSEDFGYDVNELERMLKDISKPTVWRDDIQFPIPYSKRIFKYLLTTDWKSKFYYGIDGKYHPHETIYFKEYNIFWNLFLCAIDDDIYNEQLPNVVELAHYLDFDEPMMRDWCRAVEYVLAGNKLSEDCDLECETVEGARFFLHKEE